MSKHFIIELVSIEGEPIYLDASRIEAIVARQDPLQCQIVTGSEVYNIQLEAEAAAKLWKEAL